MCTKVEFFNSITNTIHLKTDHNFVMYIITFYFSKIYQNKLFHFYLSQMIPTCLPQSKCSIKKLCLSMKSLSGRNKHPTIQSRYIMDLILFSQTVVQLCGLQWPEYDSCNWAKDEALLNYLINLRTIAHLFYPGETISKQNRL